MKSIKADFKGIKFDMPMDTAKKVLRLQKLFKDNMTIRTWINQNNPSPRLSNILKHYEFLHDCKNINQVNPAELRKMRNCGKATINEFKAKLNKQIK